MFRLWLESSLNDLFQSAVEAFPKTQMRQHATDTIEIGKISCTPYLGVRTLFIRAEATNESRHYRPVILFKNVQFGKGLPILGEDGKIYRIRPVSENNSEVLVRCQCLDYYWRANYANHLDRSLYGNKRKKYEAKTDQGPVNPDNAPMLCKHLMKMMQVLKETGILID